LAKENPHEYANTHHNDVVPAEDADVDVAYVLSWCGTEQKMKHAIDMCRLARRCVLRGIVFGQKKRMNYFDQNVKINSVFC
jgi:hypothetical protein